MTNEKGARQERAPSQHIDHCEPTRTAGARLPAASEVGANAHSLPLDSESTCAGRLPTHIFKEFLDVEHVKGCLSLGLGSSEKSKRLVASWMVTLGWIADDVLAAIQERANGRTARWGTADFWHGCARDEALQYLTLGRYLVHGEKPELGPDSWLTMNAISYGTTPGGIPHLQSQHLDMYLSDVVARRAVLGGLRSDRLTLTALADIARGSGTVAPSPGIRRLAAAVGMGRETVIAALRRLTADGFVAVVGTGRPTRYILRSPEGLTTGTTVISSKSARR